MFAEKRARILLAACGATAGFFITAAQAQQQVFVDNFNNGSVNNSDTVPGFWQTVIDQSGSATEPVGGPLTLTAAGVNPTSSPPDYYPYTEIGSTSTQGSFNFFQQPVVLQVSGLNYSANSTVNAISIFNFGYEAVQQPGAGTVNTENGEPSDFALAILPPGNSAGQIMLGIKTNSPSGAATVWNYQYVGSIEQYQAQDGPASYETQNLGGQVRSFELVLSSQFYYLSVTSDTSPTNPTPVTKVFAHTINISNSGVTYPANNTWTPTGDAPGDPSLNIQNQLTEAPPGVTPNPNDVSSLSIGQVKVSQMNLIWTNASGDGNWFNAANWSGPAGVLDPNTIATGINNTYYPSGNPIANPTYTKFSNTPDYTSSGETFPQASGPTTVDFSSGGGTITVGTINFQSTQPYTFQGGILQFATNGSTGQVNADEGNQTINVGNIANVDYDPAVAFNAAAGATLSVNTGQMLLPAILAFNMDVNGGTVTLSGGMTTNGPVTISAGPGTANFVESDFVLNGALTLNVAAGGTLNMNTFIDYNSTPEPLTMSGAGLATVNTLEYMPSVTVTGGTLRVNSSTTANNINQGACYINALTISGGKLDLTNNDMVIDYSGSSPLTTIRGYLRSGSLYSSTASLALGTGVAYAEATEINQTSSFYGLPTDSTSLCIMYTYLGDLNLDGTVNAADNALMLSGNGTDWHNGDLNYDGVKNADDWSLYNLGVAASNARGNINNLPAPEPASLAMLGILGFGLMKRNRR